MALLISRLFTNLLLLVLDEGLFIWDMRPMNDTPSGFGGFFSPLIRATAAILFMCAIACFR